MKNEKPEKLPIRAIDLFCGAGGSSWGAKSAGVEIVAGFDLWETAGKVFEENFPGAEFIHGKLESHDIDGLVKKIGHIDMILASPECTNHSPAKGSSPRCEESKGTAFQVTRFARAFTPRWIVVENVVNMKRWTRYDEFLKELRLLGYKITEQKLTATSFGVPQSRRRLFLLCDLKTKPNSVAKSDQLKTPNAKDFVNLNGEYKWSPLRSKKRAKATLQRAERGIKVVGKKTPFLLVYYGSDGAGGWQKLNRPLRTITTVDRFAILKPSTQGHVMRMLQVPELQIAMGMTKMNFSHGTRRDRIKMIGNGVCPPVMTAVINELTKSTI